MYDFSEKTALVTGGALGIGRAIAQRIADDGGALAIFDTNEEAMTTFASELGETGTSVSLHRVDVARADEVEAAVAAIVKQRGQIDFLVNNAGVSDRSTFQEADRAHVARVFDVNIWGVYNCSRAVVPGMLQNGGGRVVNIASWVGKMAQPHYFAYSTSKFAVIGMTQAMAADLSPHGILVNAVCPGIIDNTPTRVMAEAEARERGLPSAAERLKSVPLRRLGEPADIANCVAFLLSDQAAFVTGEALNVTGGLWMS